MKVDSLGDQALFVGDSSSLSLTASSLSGIKPSCIYFTTRFDSIDDLPLFHCTHNGGGFDMACLAWKVPQLSHFTSANSFRSFVPHLGYIWSASNKLVNGKTIWLKMCLCSLKPSYATIKAQPQFLNLYSFYFIELHSSFLLKILG